MSYFVKIGCGVPKVRSVAAPQVNVAGSDLAPQCFEKAAAYSLKENPTYEDVIKVFGKLDFDDRANVAPRHPDSFREVPDDMLFDRQVAVDGDGNLVGFNEFYYGRDKLGRRQPPHNSIAVVPEARGNGLARLMVEATVRKVRKEKIRRLVWEAFADNESSIRAALSAGFEDATPKNAKGYRRFVYRVPEKQASDKEEKPISELKDGVYSGLRYGYTFELTDGTKYKTSTGTRCTREHCGGVQTYRVHDGKVLGAADLKWLGDGTYKAIHYLNIYELEDGRLFRDPDEVYVKQSRNIALRGGYKTIKVKNGEVTG